MKFIGNGNGGKRTYTQSDFREGKRTCPVCGKTDDWDCNFTEDGGLVYCKFIPNESGKKDKTGTRYQHRFTTDNKSNSVATIQPTKEKLTSTKADADRLNKVYTAFLESLELNENHFEQLINERGLSEQNLPEKLYGSVPSYEQRFEVAGELAESFNLEGIPGFYVENGKWALHLTFDGFYVPYKDELGRIVGLQIRRDEYDSKNKGKYMWLSSSSKEKGSSSGTPLHFVNSEITRKTNEIFITEGALKADIIGELHNVGVMAMGGVDVLNAEEFIVSMLKAFPNLEQVIIAFDMDWEVKEEVKNALSKMLEALRPKYLSVFVLTWDRNVGKGFDDVLLKVNRQEVSVENLFNYVKAEEFQAEYLNNETEESKSLPVDDKQVTEDEYDDFAPENMGFKSESIIKREIDTFGITCRDFLDMDFPIPERVVSGLVRGSVGLMVASTNVGKSTLALNLSLSAGMDKTYLPLFDGNHKARRVMYIDGEATKGELQADIKKMLESCSTQEQELIKNNLCFVCDEELKGEPLDLVNPEHLQTVIKKAVEFKPDLIIVDTLSALTLMEDENDNAKVKKEIIQPLKTLGRKANAGVLMLHHTGKYIEGSPQAEDSYKGRGASTLGALSRVVYNLKSIKGTENRVTLSCSKVKGEKFESVVMELDADTRWFTVVEGASAKTSTPVEQDYWKVVDYVKNENRVVKKYEILIEFTANKVMSDAKIGRILKEAVAKNDLRKDYGKYFSPNFKTKTNSNIELCKVSQKLKSNVVYKKPNRALGIKE